MSDPPKRNSNSTYEPLMSQGITADIAFRIVAEASIVIILALISGRYLSTFLIVGIPGSYYWLQPLVNYKAMQV